MFRWWGSAAGAEPSAGGAGGAGGAWGGAATDGKEEEEEEEREVQMRHARCNMIKGPEWWYTGSGTLAERATRPFREEDCVKGMRWRPFLGRARTDGGFRIPDAAPFALQHAAADTVPDHIAVVDALAPAHTGPKVPARERRHYVRKPGEVDADPSAYALPSALADYDAALTQDVLYQYFHGWADGVPEGRFDRRLDWSALLEPVDAAGHPVMPPGTCDAGAMHMKPHQVTVWTVLRAWAARQGSGGVSVGVGRAGAVGGAGAPPPARPAKAATATTTAAADDDDNDDEAHDELLDLIGGGGGARAPKANRDRVRIPDGEPLVPTDRVSPLPFDATRTPKGMLVFHSLGSGKTPVTVCGMQAFWNQRLADGTPRPLVVLTSKENKGQMIRQGDGSSRYYAAARALFPSTLGALSSPDFHGGYELLSFNQAGLRLGYPMADLAEGATPRRVLGAAKPEFVAKMRNAVILIDEVQGIFAPAPAFRNTNGGLREWLSSPEADGTTVVLLTATPGKSVAELFGLLNTIKRAGEQLAPADYAAQRDGEWVMDVPRFRAAIAGQVSFADLSNNTHDFPELATQVVAAPMSPAHFGAWRERALADAREEAAGGPKAWSHLFNKDEYARHARGWSNMVSPASKLGGVAARDVYRRGNLDEVRAFSAKLAELVGNIVRIEGKQYAFSAFGEQGMHQIADVLAAPPQGWTNVSGKLRPLYDALVAVRAAEAAGNAAATAAAMARFDAAAAALPGTPFKRFITTRDWKDETAGGSGSSGGSRATGQDAEDEDDGESKKRSTTEQLMELAVFNALRNTHGEVIGALLATKKFNEGLDLKAIRAIHIFEPLISVAAELQTVGRGRRYCSAAALEPSQRNLVVYHYFSVPPQGQDELADSIAKYEDAAKSADANAARATAHVAQLQERVHVLAARAGALQRGIAPSSDLPPPPPAASAPTAPLLAGAFADRAAHVAREAADMSWAVARGAARGAAKGFREWWDDGGVLVSAAAREADAHVAEVRAAVLAQERVLAATERRVADAKAVGKADLMATVAADVQRDRVKYLREALAAATKGIAADVKTLAKTAGKTTGKTADAVRAQLTAVQGEIKAVVADMEVAVGAVADAKAAAAALRTHAAEARTKLLPEWRAALEEGEGVVGTGKDGRVLKRDLEAAAKATKAATPVMPTDTYVHGISRREYVPMRALLQALRDAAIDCKVMHRLHATMGIRTECRI